MWAVTARWALVAMTPFLVPGTGCGDDPARLTLEPVALPLSCGRPKNATAIRVTAYAADRSITRAVGLDETVDLAEFPDSTEQIGVEVAIGGGAFGAIGKTMPLAYGELKDKALVPIVMLPPNDFCEAAGFMHVARRAPLVARAGDGVLVVGGSSATGEFLGSAEYYDPSTATFTEVPVSDVLGGGGFAGASLVTLPDGRVAVSGGPQPVITIFDPVTKTFGESVLIVPRAFHTSIALGDDQLLLAGGCEDSSGGACIGIVRNSTAIYDSAKLGANPEVGPVLRVAHVGATAFELGELEDGRPWFVLAGGTALGSSDPMGADLISPREDEVMAVTGMSAQVAALDGGALISAFAPDTDAAASRAAILAPGATLAVATASAPALVGARLITLEDGRVAAFGGDPAGGVALYDPTLDRWTTTPLPMDSKGPGALAAPTLIRLADGSVLVFDGGMARQSAYLYRPSLDGPAAGSITVAPGNTTTVLTPSDPATVVRSPTWQLRVTEGELARALVGGPRTATGTVTATVRVKFGGVALIAEQVAPGNVLVGELAEGMKARIVRRSGGETRVLCSGKTVEPFDPEVGVTVHLEIAGKTARLLRETEELASCDVDTVARGAWGVAALGSGGHIIVDNVTVAR